MKSSGWGLAILAGLLGWVLLAGPGAARQGTAEADKVQAQVRVVEDRKADVEKRIAACAALQQSGPAAKAALPALVEVLKEVKSAPRQAQFRERVTTLVRPTGPDISSVPITPGAAVVELSKTRPSGEATVQGSAGKVAIGWEDRGLSLRRAALDALVRIGPDPAQTGAVLAQVLKGLPDDHYLDTVNQVERFLEKTVTVLGRLGPPARDAVGPLVEVLQGTLEGKKAKLKTSFACRMKALEALSQIDPNAPAFVRALLKIVDAGRNTTETQRQGSLGLEIAAAQALADVTAPELRREVLQALAAAKSARDPALKREVTRTIARLEQSK
jgi:hypothetical protein